MSQSLDQFVELLLRSELITPSQLRAVREQLPATDNASADDTMVQLLANSGHLTEFQISKLRGGKGEQLIVGDYLILHPIGRGGMGLVFKARHCVMKREVAVKFLLVQEEGKASPSSVERFQREVEAASKLSHPNIVSALDAGRNGAMCYLVMEYVRGMNLANYVRENGPMSFRQALDCTLQVAQGLEYAHSKGVVHRDIKPSNLLVTADGQVKLLDLGLVRNAYDDQSQRDSDATDPLTDSNQILGSVDFMAPEQALDPRSIDGRADIYSLGCTLYFLLTGKLPFREEGTSAMGRVIAHRETPVPSICIARPDVPASFERIFQKMMAKQVDKRYASMGELIDDLRKVHVGVLAMSSSLTETATMSRGRPLRASAWAAIAGLSAAVVLAGIFGLSWAGRLRTTAGTGGGAVTRITPPAPPSGPVELLSHINLDKQVVAGKEWKLAEGKLVVPDNVPSKLCIPINFPANFRVEMTVTRARADGPLVLGVSEKGRSFYLLIDAGRNEGKVRLTALGAKGGRIVASKEDALRLSSEEPTELLLVVAKDRVTLEAGDIVVLHWQGDFGELPLGGGWGVGDVVGLLIGSNNNGSFEISRLQLIPETSATTPATTEG